MSALKHFDDLRENVVTSKFGQQTNFEFEIEILSNDDYVKTADIHAISGKTKIFTMHYLWYSEKGRLHEKGWNLGGLTHRIDLNTVRELTPNVK